MPGFDGRMAWSFLDPLFVKINQAQFDLPLAMQGSERIWPRTRPPQWCLVSKGPAFVFQFFSPSDKAQLDHRRFPSAALGFGKIALGILKNATMPPVKAALCGIYRGTVQNSSERGCMSSMGCTHKIKYAITNNSQLANGTPP